MITYFSEFRIILNTIKVSQLVGHTWQVVRYDKGHEV